jgi:hypothetical protein
MSKRSAREVTKRHKFVYIYREFLFPSLASQLGFGNSVQERNKLHWTLKTLGCSSFKFHHNHDSIEYNI